MSHPQKALIAASVSALLLTLPFSEWVLQELLLLLTALECGQAMLWLGVLFAAMDRQCCADARDVQGHFDRVCAF